MGDSKYQASAPLYHTEVISTDATGFWARVISNGHSKLVRVESLSALLKEQPHD